MNNFYSKIKKSDFNARVLQTDHDPNINFLLLSPGELSVSLIDEMSLVEDSFREKENKKLSYQTVMAVVIQADSKTDLTSDIAENYKEILSFCSTFETAADQDFASLLELL